MEGTSELPVLREDASRRRDDEPPCAKGQDHAILAVRGGQKPRKKTDDEKTTATRRAFNTAALRAAVVATGATGAIPVTEPASSKYACPRGRANALKLGSISPN